METIQTQSMVDANEKGETQHFADHVSRSLALLEAELLGVVVDSITDLFKRFPERNWSFAEATGSLSSQS